jgi:hypothetical protein
MNPWWIGIIAVLYIAMWWMTALKFARAEYRKILPSNFQASSYQERLAWRRQCLIYGMVMAIPWPLTLSVSAIRDDFHNHDLMSVIPPTQEEMNLLNREREARINGLERQIWKRPRQ